jgi:hypothetical protein
MHHLDHIILGINDLEAGIARFEQLTGVQAVRGGEHPGLGTQNALVSLGEGVYLEILAPRPGVKVVEWLGSLEEMDDLTPMMWVVRTDDLDQTVRLLRDAGVELSEPVSGSRETADGLTLAWKMAHPQDPALAASAFFIEWNRDSIHPSRTSPPGCTLNSFEIADPDPRRLRNIFDVLGLNVGLYQRALPLIELVLHTPNGRVRLTSAV